MDLRKLYRRSFLSKKRPHSIFSNEFDMYDKEPVLNFPLHRTTGPSNELIQSYDIPDKAKEEVLTEMYPFQPFPELEDIFYDIHEGKTFIVRDFNVIRDHEINFPVSPYYLNSGGSVLDWMTPDRLECSNEDEDVTMTIDIRFLER